MNSNRIQNACCIIALCAAIAFVIAGLCNIESKPSKEKDLDFILNRCDTYAVVVNIVEIKVSEDTYVHKVFIKDKRNLIFSCTVEFEVNKGDTLIKK